MAEHDLWHTLRDKTKRIGHFERIENMVGRGMPDVTYCIRGVEGFIELKQLPSWPARAETVVKLDHFTPQQRIWIRNRERAGGRVYVLLEVVRPVRFYGLFRGEWARVHLGTTATEDAIRRAALVRSSGPFPLAHLVQELSGGQQLT